MIIIYICIFFLGASIASFLNATTYRVDNGYKYPDIIKSNSHCEKCKHVLTWWELFPILGYIYIGGKCSKCKDGINIYYPISELFLGLLFLSFYLLSIPWYIWIVVLFLFILSYHDVKYRAVPKGLVHVFLVLCVSIYSIYLFNIPNIYLPILVTIMFLIINLIKKSFGLGDILVLLGLGILLTYDRYIVMFWLGIVLALLYSIYLIIKKKVDYKKAKIPMIPFFTISFSISILFGGEIYKYLLKLMGIW
jgi:prepilin signal peptidase PulO-like enzyme (type II secretory pathway)